MKKLDFSLTIPCFVLKKLYFLEFASFLYKLVKSQIDSFSLNKLKTFVSPPTIAQNNFHLHQMVALRFILTFEILFTINCPQ